jgi:hypothetical protein
VSRDAFLGRETGKIPTSATLDADRRFAISALGPRSIRALHRRLDAGLSIRRRHRTGELEGKLPFPFLLTRSRLT